MKEWLRYFRIWFLVCGIILVSFVVTFFSVWKEDETPEVERVNQICTETERVFDYADVLTDEEENKLREYIAECEKETQCGIHNKI